MAITPMHSSADAATRAVEQSKNNTHTHQSQGNQAAAKANNARQAPHVTQHAQPQAPAQKATTTPKPVPNSQGQTTGTIVDATA